MRKVLDIAIGLEAASLAAPIPAPAFLVEYWPATTTWIPQPFAEGLADSCPTTHPYSGTVSTQPAALGGLPLFT